MSDANIKVQCPRCLGTGTEEIGIPPVPTPCSGCGATGYREKDKLDTTDLTAEIDTLEDKVEKIKDKLDKTKEVCDKIWDKVKDM